MCYSRKGSYVPSDVFRSTIPPPPCSICEKTRIPLVFAERHLCPAVVFVENTYAPRSICGLTRMPPPHYSRKEICTACSICGNAFMTPPPQCARKDTYVPRSMERNSYHYLFLSRAKPLIFSIFPRRLEQFWKVEIPH